MPDAEHEGKEALLSRAVRWHNSKTWVDLERQGQLGRWVTLRVCRVLKLAFG